ncbi:Glycosyltransferase involved in cell wall bisynthesis [Nonomuraea solani]|uniref:Glycosyltransferase involved in cell wall bisynthesis n=1 Tax=Nonomuraea solani TaxID=1144553 RepID=A0A1H6C201_9ACTN|nr:glycosyltransferase family 1 protein [Nonomuraea solani]SEG66962.1 Glycosyltransferase involved in cell wall bisynthesis [Nonomuraea solani]
MPRVLVDAAAVPADRGALIRYVDGLVAALHQAGADLAVVCQRSEAERYRRLAPSARVIPGPVAITNRAARLAWEQTGLPLLARKAGADVIHAPYYSIPLSSGLPTVVTVHDATWFTEPDQQSPRASFFRSATRTAVRHARRVIVPSKATRDELVRVLSADPTRIDVAYHGVDLAQFHPPSEEEIRRTALRIGLHGQPYVAFLGALDPRKNVPNLIRGFAAAVKRLDKPPALVLGGGVHEDDVDAACREVEATVKVVRPGYLRAPDLPGFLGGALVVAFPSRGEGFGLPVLEAMACGAPVLTTHRSSLPEVGGDAVAYTEPDADSIAMALGQLLASSDRRGQLQEAGLARAREFTWDASAEAHLSSYQRAIE